MTIIILEGLDARIERGEFELLLKEHGEAAGIVASNDARGHRILRHEADDGGIGRVSIYTAFTIIENYVRVNATGR